MSSNILCKTATGLQYTLHIVPKIPECPIAKTILLKKIYNWLSEILITRKNLKFIDIEWECVLHPDVLFKYRVEILKTIQT